MPAVMPPDQPDAVDDGLQIVAAGVVAFLEVAEVDRRRTRGSARVQRDRPAVLLVCALRTTQVRQFGMLAQPRRIAGVVALESRPSSA